MVRSLLPLAAALAACTPSPDEAAVHRNHMQPADTPAQAEGRRTLSTALAMAGPDARLAVELRDGRVLVLRDVVIGPNDYCGVLVLGGPAGTRYCGGYAEVAAARPGSAAPR